MNIRFLESVDVSPLNSEINKINLADKIISTIKPFIDKNLNETEKSVDNINRKVIFKQNEVSTKKEKIIKDSEQIKRQEKISQLLKNIEKLVELKVTDNTSFKNELLILLKIIPKLNIEKLDKHINKTAMIIKKRN